MVLFSGLIQSSLLALRHFVTSYPGSFPEKLGGEPGRSVHVPRDVLCVVLDVVLIIVMLPTQSVLSDTVRLRRCWSFGSVDIAETTDGHWKAV